MIVSVVRSLLVVVSHFTVLVDLYQIYDNLFITPVGDLAGDQAGKVGLGIYIYIFICIFSQK